MEHFHLSFSLKHERALLKRQEIPSQPPCHLAVQQRPGVLAYSAPNIKVIYLLSKVFHWAIYCSSYRNSIQILHRMLSSLFDIFFLKTHIPSSSLKWKLLIVPHLAWGPVAFYKHLDEGNSYFLKSKGKNSMTCLLSLQMIIFTFLQKFLLLWSPCSKKTISVKGYMSSGRVCTHIPDKIEFWSKFVILLSFFAIFSFQALLV